MVIALFTVNAGLDRARRRSNGASTLSVLQVLAGREGIRPSAIAEQLGVHPSLVTRQVQELEDAGYVDVTVDPVDARSLRVTLTRSGSREQQRLVQIGLDRFASFVADWEPDEVRTLTALLEKLERSKAAAANDNSGQHPRHTRARRRARRAANAAET
jgi:DNA-binding MarR family transcriptional regulator